MRKTTRRSCSTEPAGCLSSVDVSSPLWFIGESLPLPSTRHWSCVAAVTCRAAALRTHHTHRTRMRRTRRPWPPSTSRGSSSRRSRCPRTGRPRPGRKSRSRRSPRSHRFHRSRRPSGGLRCGARTTKRHPAMIKADSRLSRAGRSTSSTRTAHSTCLLAPFLSRSCILWTRRQEQLFIGRCLPRADLWTRRVSIGACNSMFTRFSSSGTATTHKLRRMRRLRREKNKGGLSATRWSWKVDSTAKGSNGIRIVYGVFGFPGGSWGHSHLYGVLGFTHGAHPH